MTKLYIFDLDGTTGAYVSKSTCGIVQITAMFLRPCLDDSIQLLNDKNINYVIATRGSKDYAEAVVNCWKNAGIDWKGKIYSRNDVSFNTPQLFAYKNLEKIYQEQNITDPKKEAVMIGDLLSFEKMSTGVFRIEDYLTFDFEKDSEPLWKRNKLIDHPYPLRLTLPFGTFNTPVYVVLPQAFTYNINLELVTIDMLSLINFLEQMHSVGEEDFSQGYETLKSLLKKNSLNLTDSQLNVPHQFVESDGLEKATWGKHLSSGVMQKYLVMKALQSELKQLKRIIY